MVFYTFFLAAMSKCLMLLIIVDLLLLKNSLCGSVHRAKRGLLSRTGLCPNPHKNFQIRDNRLNFYGTGYLLPPSDPMSKESCQENECSFDYQCEGDQRCCKNVCGASVCTPALRDPHPCSLFTCPDKKICKLQRVRCIYPDCPDLYAVPRPICVPARLVPEQNGARSLGSIRELPEPYIYPEHAFYKVPRHSKRSALDQNSVDDGLFYVYEERPFYEYAE